MPFLCWITSCNLPQAESLRCVRSGLMVTPVRPELIEYLRTVMTVFSVKKNKNKNITLHWFGSVFSTLKDLADGVINTS